MKLKLFLISVAFTIASNSTTVAQDATVNFQLFYDELSPHGQWVDYPDYGYVWMPTVEVDFSPYSTSGYWVLTNYGWTWVSDYSWGWAPFHYGRWNYDNFYGWFWIPQNEWGPAWVTWRHSNDYYGWAPMGYGISINASFGSGYHVPHEHWRFVRGRDINRKNINNYYAPRTNNANNIKNSTVIQNTNVDNERHVTYISGPSREDVQKEVGTKINTINIRENNKPGQHLKNNELEIYRPRVQENNRNGEKLVPSKVTKMEELKPSEKRNRLDQEEKQNAPINNNRAPEQKNNQPREQQVEPVRERKIENQPQPITPPVKEQQQREPLPNRSNPVNNNQRENQQRQTPSKPQPTPKQVNPQQNRQPKNGQTPSNKQGKPR